MTATPIPNTYVPIAAYPFEFHYWLELPCADYEALNSLPHAVTYDGRTYGRSGWNSDRCVAYYTTRVSVARAV